VLYIEDLNWWRINKTIHTYPTVYSELRDFRRIIYPMMYDVQCPECLQSQTQSYREGGCNTIPSVRDTYFKLPEKAEVGTYFQCPGKCEVCKKEVAETTFPSPFDCKLSDHPKWYDNHDLPLEPDKQDMPISKISKQDMPLSFQDLHVVPDEDHATNDTHGKQLTQLPLAIRIIGSAVVLLCVSAVCLSLSKARRNSSGYVLAEQVEKVETGLLTLPAE